MAGIEPVPQRDGQVLRHLPPCRLVEHSCGRVAATGEGRYRQVAEVGDMVPARCEPRHQAGVPHRLRRVLRFGRRPDAVERHAKH
jgi:hypothetical protein